MDIRYSHNHTKIEKQGLSIGKFCTDAILKKHVRGRGGRTKEDLHRKLDLLVILLIQTTSAGMK